MGSVRIIVAGGGTGGHIYPALAVAQILRERGAEVLYVGTRQGMEAQLVPREGFPFHPIRVSGIRGKSLGQAAAGAGRAAVGLLECLTLLGRFRPRAVLGTGGYVTGPVVLAAICRRVPVVLQEQNVIPGATNRLLAPFCRAVCVPYAQCLAYFPSGARLVVTGNPVRPAVLARSRLEGCRVWGWDPSRPGLLILGGSRGARRVVEAALEALPLLAARCPETQVLLVTGREYYQEARARLGRLPEGWRVEPYVHNMEDALAVADLVVGRAGAMTVAEVTARGIPALLIPSPHVVGNHQERNARLLEKAGAARVLTEEELKGQALAQAVAEILADPARRQVMAESARRLGKPDAARRVAELVWSAAERMAAR